ncbi:ABC transporter permease [Halovivax cerinus]|uniref:ABC transporter permease n=1 Tax=Halovivax cerinus TaxID=1487865 RepID=A0ABD5NRA6_9EURY|nr:ABC transporter permease [Halovivax cerinus]
MATSTRTSVLDTVDVSVRRWAPRVVAIGLTYGLWYVIATMFPSDLMPYPLETLELTWDLYVSGQAFTHLIPSLSRIGIAFVAAMIIGTGVGVAMGSTNFGQLYFAPFVVIGLALPSVALAAIMRLIFGYTFVAPVVAATLAVVPFVTVNIWKGVENIDQDLLEMASSFDVSNLRLLWRIVIPNTAPSLFAATRFGLALSWKVVTVVEVFAASSGIGYMVNRTYQSFRFEQSFAWAVVFIVVVIFVEYLVLKPLERRMFEYRQDVDFDFGGVR